MYCNFKISFLLKNFFIALRLIVRFYSEIYSKTSPNTFVNPGFGFCSSWVHSISCCALRYCEHKRNGLTTNIVDFLTKLVVEIFLTLIHKLVFVSHGHKSIADFVALSCKAVHGRPRKQFSLLFVVNQ